MEHAFIGYFLWQTIKLPEGNGSKKPSTSVTSVFFPEFPGKKYRKPVYLDTLTKVIQGYPRMKPWFFGVKPWT
jgi:hypothetical protein